MNGYEVFDELCKAHKVTPYQVSKKTGVTTATLSSWKNGRYVPKANKLQKIADYFNVSLGYLMGRNESDKELYDRYREQLFAREKEKKILELYRKLNTEGQQKAQAYLEDLAGLRKYTEPLIEEGFA